MAFVFFFSTFAVHVPPAGFSKTGGKSKKLKDPNAPKKPSTAFFLFMADNRARVKEENPDITPAQVGKTLGAEWRELDAKDKAEYEATYETNLEQWRKDKLAYALKLRIGVIKFLGFFLFYFF